MRFSTHSALMLSGFLIAGCSEPAVPAASPRAVEVVDLSTSRVGTSVFSGVIRATDRADLGFPIGGEVRSMPVELGDRFAAGDTLAVLDDAEPRAERAAVEARLDEARAESATASRDAGRFEALLGTGAVAESDIEAASTRSERAARRVAVVEADLERAEARLSDYRLIASFSGRVTGRMAEPSTVVGAGQAILSVAGTGRGFEAVVTIPEGTRATFPIGGEAEILFRAGLEPALARVSEVSAGARNGGLVEIVMTVPEAPADLLPGQRIEVRSLGEELRLLLPPGSYITQSDSVVSVFVIEGDSVARERTVGVAGITDAGLIVRSGVEAGERIAVRGAARLRDGDQVVPSNLGVARYND